MFQTNQEIHTFHFFSHSCLPQSLWISVLPPTRTTQSWMKQLCTVMWVIKRHCGNSVADLSISLSIYLWQTVSGHHFILITGCLAKWQTSRLLQKSSVLCTFGTFFSLSVAFSCLSHRAKDTFFAVAVWFDLSTILSHLLRCHNKRLFLLKKWVSFVFFYHWSIL